jgi:hypothetical protein
VAGHVGDLTPAERTFCPHCFHDLWQGQSCKRRTCPGYAPIYLRDQAERLKAGLAEWDGETTIATLTAPGADVLPWDTRRCRSEGPHKHSGPNGCQVDQWAAAEWNKTTTKRLSRLVHAAIERVRRARLARPELLATVLELKRGVFHAHVIVGYYGYSRQGLELFLDALDELRGGYGFGTSKRGGFDRGKPGKYSGPHAGLYSSKYLRPDGAKGSFIPALLKIEQVIERDPETGRPRQQVRPVYVNSKLTRKSGVTMRFLRWSRYAYRRWGALSRREMLFIWQLVSTFQEPFGRDESMQIPEVLPKPPPAHEQLRLEPLKPAAIPF